jgi:hypothetical protein
MEEARRLDDQERHQRWLDAILPAIALILMLWLCGLIIARL